MRFPPPRAAQRPGQPGRIGPLALIRRVLTQRRGASASEYAIIAGPFFIMVLGIMETAWQLATGMALDHAALRASRYGMTGSNTPPSWLTQNQQNVPTCRSNNIRWMISRATNNLVKDNADLVVTTNTWSAVNAISGGGGAAGVGSGGQIVSYTITYRQPFITGLVANSLWGGSNFQHQSFLVVKNEPFENATC